MNQEEARALLKKYAEGKCSQEEKLLFETLYAKISDQAEDDSTPVELQQIEKEIYIRLPQPIKTRKIQLWPRIVAVAAAIAFIVLGVYFFNYRNHEILKQVQDDVVENDVAPGQVGATLTLASGKKIRLSDAANGELASEAGVMISKSADGRLVYEIKGSVADPDKINTLSTAKGETYQVHLPDGSMVYLNAASSLTYAASLIERGKRVVRLRGEGYFEIFKDKKHPFVVQTDRQEVEVLGTHFNINAYQDEAAVVTTLLEGSVKVTSENSKQILKPGQQALNPGNDIEVTKADMETVTDWKNGDFFLNRVDFRTAMRKIARWYDVEVIYDQSVPNDMESSGYISRTNKLSAILKSIEKSSQVHFKVEGRRIYVSK